MSTFLGAVSAAEVGVVPIAAVEIMEITSANEIVENLNLLIDIPAITFN